MSVVEEVVVEEIWPPPLPEYRFMAFHLLPEAIQTAATELLSYDEDTWDLPFSNNVEEMAYSSLDEEQQSGAVAIGLDETSWDCWINHYAELTWEEMEQEEVTEYYAVLGWNQELWDSDEEAPESDDTEWVDLTDDEREAAEAVCYFEDLWDLDPDVTLEDYELPQNELPAGDQSRFLRRRYN